MRQKDNYHVEFKGNIFQLRSVCPLKGTLRSKSTLKTNTIVSPYNIIQFTCNYMPAIFVGGQNIPITTGVDVTDEVSLNYINKRPSNCCIKL